MGNEHFAGEEAVWLKELPVYAMNYYGWILSENFNIDFLKEMLSIAQRREVGVVGGIALLSG